MTVRAPEYLAWLRTLPCAWCGRPGPSEASHHGEHGVATKASDLRALPLCGTTFDREGCHHYWHRTGSLPGSEMDREQLDAWTLRRALDHVEVWVERRPLDHLPPLVEAVLRAVRWWRDAAKPSAKHARAILDAIDALDR